VNVDQQPEAFAELRRLGVPLVPAVAVDERAAHGWNPEAYAALLGVTYQAPGKLAPAELLRRLDVILETTERFLRAAPPAFLDSRPPERDRTVKNLGYHVFRLAIALADGMDLGTFPESWLQEQVPPSMSDGAAVASYGADVRRRLHDWASRLAPADYQRTIAVYYGPQSAHDLLERTTWHAAQHLRQLHVLAERAGVASPAPLPADVFEGLPLPDAVW
jgi:hypothetical protein